MDGMVEAALPELAKGLPPQVLTDATRKGDSPEKLPPIKLGVRYLISTSINRVCYLVIKTERERERWIEKRRTSDITFTPAD